LKSSDVTATLTPTHIALRELKVADARVYREFRLRALREHPEAFTSDFEQNSRLPLADTEKRLSSPNEKLWGAFADGALAGMVGLSVETRQKSRHKGTLVGMYVSPEATGLGLGRALVDAVIGQARSSGIEHLVLTVTAGNAGAVALYEKSGFVTFGIEPDAIRVNNVSFAKQHMYLQVTPP
jgi:ribosomal protein S18 acetylase RimI-like enzyme